MAKRGRKSTKEKLNESQKKAINSIGECSQCILLKEEIEKLKMQIEELKRTNKEPIVEDLNPSNYKTEQAAEKEVEKPKVEVEDREDEPPEPEGPDEFSDDTDLMDLNEDDEDGNEESEEES